MKTICYLLTLLLLQPIVSCGNSETGKYINEKKDSFSPKLTAQIINTENENDPEIIADSENSTLNGLGKYLFDCIKRGDYTGYSKYIPTASVLKSVLKNSSDKEKANTSDGELTKSFKRILAESKSMFDLTISQGRNLGLIWNQAVFKKTEYKISNEGGVEAGELFILFTYKGVEYKLRLREVFKAKISGWYMVGPLYFVSDEDLFENTLIDSTAG